MVDDEFGSGEVGRVSADVERVLDEVATDSEACAFRFGLLRAIIADDATVCDGTVGWDIFVGDKKYGVGALDPITNTLSKAAEFVGKGTDPGVLRFGIGRKSAIFEDLAGFWMEDSVGEVFGGDAPREGRMGGVLQGSCPVG